MFIITLCITIPTGNESGLPGGRKMMAHQDFAKVFLPAQSSPHSPDPLWISRLVVATAWRKALIHST